MSLLTEGKDYDLVPIQDDEDGWEVRLLEGPHPETVIRFANIQMDGRGRDDVELRYSFVVVSSPDASLTHENVELQEYVGDVLYTIIHYGLQDGSLLTKEREQ